MAKVVKDTRETIDIDTELENLKRGKKTKEKTKEVKKDAKKDTKKKASTKKKEVKTKKTHFQFLKDVRSEMAKVKWPSKKDMVKYSIATIVFVVFFALFFYAIDVIIALLKEVS